MQQPTPRVWVLLGKGQGGNAQMINLAEALGWPYRDPATLSQSLEPAAQPPARAVDPQRRPASIRPARPTLAGCGDRRISAQCPGGSLDQAAIRRHDPAGTPVPHPGAAAPIRSGHHPAPVPPAAKAQCAAPVRCPQPHPGGESGGRGGRVAGGVSRPAPPPYRARRRRQQLFL